MNFEYEYDGFKARGATYVMKNEKFEGLECGRLSFKARGATYVTENEWLTAQDKWAATLSERWCHSIMSF